MATAELNEMIEAASKNAFKPYCYVSEEADAVTFKFLPDADYSERLSDHVTLFRSIDTKKLTGIRIKGFRSVVEDLPNYLGVDHDGIKLSMVFLSVRGVVGDEVEREEFNELAKAASKMPIPC